MEPLRHAGTVVGEGKEIRSGSSSCTSRKLKQGKRWWGGVEQFSAPWDSRDMSSTLCGSTSWREDGAGSCYRGWNGIQARQRTGGARRVFRVLAAGFAPEDGGTDGIDDNQSKTKGLLGRDHAQLRRNARQFARLRRGPWASARRRDFRMAGFWGSKLTSGLSDG